MGYKYYSFRLSLLLVILLPSWTNEVEGSIYLYPSDVSVSAGSLLPLSCVTRGSEQASWFRNNQLIASSTQTRLLSEQYTTDDGSRYTIRTLVLCGVESQDGGVYECGVDGGSNVTFTVNVHKSSTATFKLRLLGVSNCGDWNSNDSARSQKVQELVSTLQRSALQGLCSTQSQQCSYDITNPSFDCIDGTESDTVTFAAFVEVQSNGSVGSVTADNVVSLIDNWKEAESPTVTLLFQTLSIDSSCTTNTSAPCLLPNGVDANREGLTEVGKTQISWIVGGAVIGLVVICVTIVIVALIISKAFVKQKKPSLHKNTYISTRPNHDTQLTDPTLPGPNSVLTNLGTHSQRVDTLDKNAAYGHTSFSGPTNMVYMGEDALVERVYDNDHLMSDPNEEREVVPLTSDDEMYDDNY